MKKFAFLLFCMSLFVVLTATAKDEEENTYRYELENLTDRTMADGQIMEQYVRCVERFIQENPDNWLWSHRRWKHQRNLKEVA